MPEPTVDKISRRGFVKSCVALGGTAVLSGTIASIIGARDTDNPAFAANPDKPLRHVRSTCSPNCTGGCGMVAAVQDGKIKTIIQAADYPEVELNPRGCLKGLSMSNLVYGPNRMIVPQLRVDGSKPGTDNFTDVTWEEALDTAAVRLQEIADKYGPESIACIVQVAATGHVHKGALSRLAALAGWSMHGGYDMNGDLPMSAPMTFGVQSEENESYCWPDARYIMVFGSNLAATRIPDAHFLHEAQQAGAKMLVFDPNYSVTASKADEWHSINVGSDAAVALGMARVIIDEGLYDSNFVKIYSDLPFLIRRDTNQKLLAQDVAASAGLDVPADIPCYRRSHVFVTTDGRLRASNPQELLADVVPEHIALEGSASVQLGDGRIVEATTAFSLLRTQLEDYGLEQTEQLTGMPGADIARIARQAATTSPLHLIYGASNYQWYHGDLKGRALALLPVLTGNIGNLGGGFSTYAGQYRMRFKPAAWWKVDGKGPAFVPFEYVVHGPTETMTARFPKNGIRAWIIFCCNPFDQHNLNNQLREQKQNGHLELVINLDFQKTTSSLYSDILLPGVTWYEKTELVTSPVHQYLQLMQPAIEPVGQCRPELWIFRELARRLDTDFDQYFFPELGVEEATSEVIRLLLAQGGDEVEGITLEQLRKGPVKMHHGSYGTKRIPFYEQIHDGQPFPPVSYPEPLENTAQFVKSGRIEFYKDEPTFIELGEALPVHKAPYEETEYALDPTYRERFRFSYITRNSIHRVHSTHADNQVLLELKDHRPKLLVNPHDAAAKGVQADSKVEIYNDRGSITAFAVLDPGVKSGVVIFEEGWWQDQLNGSYNALIYPHIKPTHEVYFVPQMWSPNTNWNECLCDFRPVGVEP
ncbi:MAG: molybdopterin-dependent oxidoreductase [Coriobacteriales bacterium]|jgi:anaerobic selenocysteine-containing dehydrogenase|nr:molybdopterin-dependent oxidoreductase [Coriobacteriales bacterium]